MSIRPMLFALLAALPLTKFQQDPTPPKPAPTASVPVFPNSACPIMGKPVSHRLFAETEKGRVYVCCKSCIKDILADVDTAYATAYPTTKKVGNKVCPISGDPIPEKAPRVLLQGIEFAVHTEAHVALARAESQIALAKLDDPKLVDLGNQTCPISGGPTAKNTFVVIEGTLVRLSSPKVLEEVQKDPAAALKKARELRAKEARDAEKPKEK